MWGKLLGLSVLKSQQILALQDLKYFSWLPPCPVCSPFPGYVLSELTRLDTAGLGALSLDVKIPAFPSCGCCLALLSRMTLACQIPPFLIIRLSRRFYCKHFLLLVLLDLCICAIICIDFIFYTI